MKDIFVYDDGKAVSRISVGGSLQDIRDAVASMAETASGLHVVCDRNVKQYAEPLLAGMGPYLSEPVFIEASERNKTMSTVMDICGKLTEHDADRASVVLAIGGGITTDMAGFAASIYRRGVKFAFIPTTLLAQVDAAIGGKTGVNMDAYKNMLGVIRQPVRTFICTDFLKSLPYRDFMSGASEMVKTFLIEDNGFYDRALSYLSGLAISDDRTACMEEHMEELTALIAAAAAVKAGIVSRDQFESGERRKLNLGHTFAHAIEKNARSAGSDITHGEAVAMGMTMAAGLSERLGYAEAGYAMTLKAGFKAAGLRTDCPFGIEELVSAMEKDKKSEGRSIHFVLVAGPGKVRTEAMTAAAAAELLKGFIL